MNAGSALLSNVFQKVPQVFPYCTETCGSVGPSVYDLHAKTYFSPSVNRADDLGHTQTVVNIWNYWTVASEALICAPHIYSIIYD